QRLLAGEVVVDGTAGHLARRRDVLQRGPAVPALGEQGGRLVQQCGPGGLRVHLPAALDLGHALSIVTYAVYVTIVEYVVRAAGAAPPDPYPRAALLTQAKEPYRDRDPASAALRSVRTRLHRRPVPAVRGDAGAGAGVRPPVRVLAAHRL